MLVCGHTHLPWQQTLGEHLICNPGSVGAPLTGDVRASYALLTWMQGHWQVEHYAIAYDLAAVQTAFHETGLLEEGGSFARACLVQSPTSPVPVVSRSRVVS